MWRVSRVVVLGAAIAGALLGGGGCGLRKQSRPVKSPVIQVRLNSLGLAECGATPGPGGEPAPAGDRLVSASVGFDEAVTPAPIWACPRQEGDPDYGRCVLPDGTVASSGVCPAEATAQLNPGRPGNHYRRGIEPRDDSVSLVFRLGRGASITGWTVRVSTETGAGTVVGGGPGGADVTLHGAAGGCATSPRGDR
jgi:hypothetical protein